MASSDNQFTVLTGSGDVIPAGIVVMWSGSVATIPATWALCDGTLGTPDLRDRFVVAAIGSGDEGTSGGVIAPDAVLTPHAAHVVTQPGAHAAHVVTQPGAHAAHVVTQPNAHTAHVVTQPGAHAAHVVTQPNAHTDVPNHTHPVTDPGHFHDEFRNGATTGGLDGWGAGDTSTNTPTLTGYDTGSKVTGVATQNPAGGVASQPHAGTAVDGHSAHAGTAVDDHSAHAGTAVDGHSAHAGTAVDGHSAHAGTAVDGHSAHALQRFYKLAYIMKL